MVGQTSGQCVNPKKIANGLPASRVLANGRPSLPTSVNGPPIEASGSSLDDCAGGDGGGRVASQTNPTKASATSGHRIKRMRVRISARPAR